MRRHSQTTRFIAAALLLAGCGRSGGAALEVSVPPTLAADEPTLDTAVPRREVNGSSSAQIPTAGAGAVTDAQPSRPVQQEGERLRPTGQVGELPTAIPCETAPEGMACIPGGPFIRGSDTGPENARPQAVVWVQTFYMDKNEVTYEQYKACERRGRCPRAKPLYKDFDAPAQPMNGVSWYDARRYCEVQGKRLPTEAQWEKAARGDDGRFYPWGDEVATCERAVIRNGKGERSCGVKKRGQTPEKGKPWPVGSKPPTLYGLYDMAGNSWEWVADWYSGSYESCGAACLGIDPRGPCDGAERCKGHRRKIVRGGSWYWKADRATTVYRRPHVPSNSPFHHFGFRCGATVTQAQQLRDGDEE